MAASVEYEGATFAALYPVNAPVSLAQMQDERLVPLDATLETEEHQKNGQKAVKIWA